MRAEGALARDVFLSYIPADAAEAGRLRRDLELAGIRVWADDAELLPGDDVRMEVGRAIRDGALVFVACFSGARLSDAKSYHNEELLLAVEQLRLRPPHVPWLIPVRFDDCDIPEYEVGGGRTLSSLKPADLFGVGRDREVGRLVAAIRRILGRQASSNRPADGRPVPGALLRSYLDDAVRSAREHPHVTAWAYSEPLSLGTVYLRQFAKSAGSQPARLAELAAVPSDVILDLAGDCLVTGDPGVGKTSLLRATVIDAAGRWHNAADQRIEAPVFVSAADLRRKPNVADAIADGAALDLGSRGQIERLPAAFFAREPLPGIRWLVLVDGLDEITDPQGRQDVLTKIAGASRKDRSPYRFVVATRPLPGDELGRFGDWPEHRYDLQPFAADELGDVAVRWFTALQVPDPDQLAGAFLAALGKTLLAPLARTKLMAAILCQLQAAYPDEELPRGRAQAYERFVGLLEERATKIGQYSQAELLMKEHGPAAVAAAKDVLAHRTDLIDRIAFERLSGDTTPIISQLNDLTSAQRPARPPREVWKQFLADVLRSSGVLAQRGDDFVFLHYTIVEYLAARHIASDPDASAAAFHELFEKWHQPPAGRRSSASSRRQLPARAQFRVSDRWWQPPRYQDSSHVGFLIAEWSREPEKGKPERAEQAKLTSALVRLATQGAFPGCRFIVLRRKEATILDPVVVNAAFDMLAQIAADPAHEPRDNPRIEGSDRLDAATWLTELDDPRGRDLLAAQTADPSLLGIDRYSAAWLLADLGDPRTLELMTALSVATDLRERPGYVEVADSIRFSAATRVASVDPAGGADAIAAQAVNPAVTEERRLSAVAWLIQVADSRGMELLSQVGPSLKAAWRWQAAVMMAVRDDPRGQDLLTDSIAQFPRSKPDAFWRALVISQLLQAGELDRAVVLAGHVERTAIDTNPEVQLEADMAFAASGLLSGQLFRDAALRTGHIPWQAAEALVLTGSGDLRVMAMLAVTTGDPVVQSHERWSASRILEKASPANRVELNAALAYDLSLEPFYRELAAQNLTWNNDPRGNEIMAQLRRADGTRRARRIRRSSAAAADRSLARITEIITAAFSPLPFPDCIAFYQQVLDQSERYLGTEHTITLRMRERLAIAHVRTGGTDQAISLFGHLLEDQRRLPGGQVAEILTTLVQVGAARSATGDSEGGLRLAEQAFREGRETLDEDDPQMLALTHNLAVAHEVAGQASASIPYYELALSRAERLLGADHPDTMTYRTNLAEIRRKAKATDAPKRV